jgi:hypothetical protein
MGMHISSSSAMNVYQSQMSAARSQRHQQFDALAQALKSGDTKAASSAYASLVPSGSNVDPSSPLGMIGAALQAGNLSAAEAALPPRFQNAASASTPSPFNLLDPNASSSANGTSTTQASADPTQTSPSASNSAAGPVGHHHHHHGGGGSMMANSSSSSSTQNGSDMTTASFLNAKAAMANLVTDLQNLASSSTASSTGTSANPAVPSNVATGASNLLNNPDFQNLESAVNSGNTTSMNTAWSQFIANTFGNANAAGAVSSTISTVA